MNNWELDPQQDQNTCEEKTLKRQAAGPLLSLSLAIFASLFSNVPLTAQSNSSTPPVPEFENRYYEVASDGKLVALELDRPKGENKSSNMVFKATSSSMLAIPNAASTVRVSSTPHLVIKADTRGMDPSTYVKIAKLTVSGNERVFPMSKSSGSILGGHSNTPDITYIPITMKKYADKSYEVVPVSPIPPGEYAIYTEGNQVAQMECFGVD